MPFIGIIFHTNNRLSIYSVTFAESTSLNFHQPFRCGTGLAFYLTIQIYHAHRCLSDLVGLLSGKKRSAFVPNGPCAGFAEPAIAGVGTIGAGQQPRTKRGGNGRPARFFETPPIARFPTGSCFGFRSVFFQ